MSDRSYKTTRHPSGATRVLIWIKNRLVNESTAKTGGLRQLRRGCSRTLFGRILRKYSALRRKIDSETEYVRPRIVPGNVQIKFAP